MATRGQIGAGGIGDTGAAGAGRNSGGASGTGNLLGLWPRLLLAGLGAAGFAASLSQLYLGVRKVVETTGGFCASGGPYVIAHQCPAGATRMILIGIFGGLVAAAVFAGATSWAGGSALVAGLLMWAALFGSLGWDLVTTARGSTPTGVMFLVMALGGLVPVGALVVGWVRHRGEPPAPLFPTDAIVRASGRVP